MRASIFSLISLSLLGVTLPLLMTSSCGRAPIESLEEPGGTINVTGAFSDWTPSTSSFAGGVFLLLDPNTNEVFKSELIDAGKPVFKIENVPVTGKYYGILLDNRFEPRAYLEKTGSDSKKQRVFKLGSTAGNFGTLVVRDDVIASSEHSGLEFQANYGAQRERGKWTKIPFPAKFSTAFVPNPDIDGDGEPNVIDTDVDGDGIQNILDPVTYDETDITDSKIPAQFNYGYGIPNKGFFKCDHLRKPTSEDNSSFDLHFSCGLKLSAGTVDKVELVTSEKFKVAAKNLDVEGTPFDWQMRDFGTLGDLISNDGISSGVFQVTEGNSIAYKNQVILATATMKDGSKKTYITTLEPNYELKKKDQEPVAEFIDRKILNVTFSLGSLSEKVDGFQIAATIFGWDKKEIKTFTQALANPNTATIQDLEQLNLSPTIDDKKYRIKIRVTAPAALPGLLGSAFELYSEQLTYPPP